MTLGMECPSWTVFFQKRKVIEKWGECNTGVCVAFVDHEKSI
jgi:hypothetical protein